MEAGDRKRGEGNDVQGRGTKTGNQRERRSMRAAVNAGRAVVLLLGFASAPGVLAQDIPVPQLKPGSDRKPAPSAAVVPATPQTIQLIVSPGTPIQVALDQEVRVQKTGQTIHARVVEPVYAFDKLVVPVGSEAIGRITQIEATSRGKRTEAALNADFTPVRNVHVEFTEIVLKDGKHIPVHTSVAPGSGEVLRFSSAGEGE